MPDKIRVLAVDDAVANLAVIRGCLRGKDIDLTTKTNALDALQAFKENFFDVLLLDVLMPGISGFELRKLIREIDKERPIIFFTSMIDDSNMTMLKSIAWDPYTFYLSKVTDKEILLKKIMEITQANRMRKLDQMRSLKLEEELHLASDLQKLMLPHWCVLSDEIYAGSLYEPALLTSGDIFEFAKLSDGRILFFIGDISGHGISAALYMSTIQTYLKMLPGSLNLTVDKILSDLNKFVCQKIKNNVYLTAAVAIIDFVNNKMILHNAGHLPLTAYVPERGVEQLVCKSEAPPLGWFEDSKYNPEDNLEYEFTDDTIFVGMTDGVLDLEDNNKQSISAGDLEQLMLDIASGADAAILPYQLYDALKQIGYSKVNDDVTVVAFQKRIKRSNFIDAVIPQQMRYVDEIAKKFSGITGDMRFQIKIELCLHEFLNNIIIHGARGIGSDLPIYLSIERFDATYKIRILDCGEPWNLQLAEQQVKIPEETKNGDERNIPTSGRGLQILQQITKSISYNSYSGINETIFIINEFDAVDGGIF